MWKKTPIVYVPQGLPDVMSSFWELAFLLHVVTYKTRANHVLAHYLVYPRQGGPQDDHARSLLYANLGTPACATYLVPSIKRTPEIILSTLHMCDWGHGPCFDVRVLCKAIAFAAYRARRTSASPNCWRLPSIHNLGTPARPKWLPSLSSVSKTRELPACPDLCICGQ